MVVGGRARQPRGVRGSPTAPFLSSTDLTTLPTDRPVVIYCYTGQTSAFSPTADIMNYEYAQ